MILIFPPVAKPGEPPAGIAKLAGVLESEKLPCTIIDANCEGLLFLLHQKYNWNDTWYRRAAKNTEIHLSSLRSLRYYKDLDKYIKAVKDLNRVLTARAFTPVGFNNEIRITLTDYKDKILSPVQSTDILQAAESPETNPFYPYFSRRLTEVIEQTGDTLIGFSLFYLNQVLTAFAMIGFLKKMFRHLTIIAGGGLITTWHKNPGWKTPFSGLVDEFVCGPGEKKVLDYYGDKLKTGIQPKPVIKVFSCHGTSFKPAMGFRQNRGLHYTPSYSLFPLDSYLSPPYILPYNASSGCYWKKCVFCPEKAENNSYTPIPPADALKDLLIMSTVKRPVLIHFLDNAINIPLFKALAQNPPGIPWYGYARITEHLSDNDFCLDLKNAGCRMLQLGLESGDEKVLEKMRKGFSLDLASRVLLALNKAGILVYVYLLFGTPWETGKAARNTLKFIAKHRSQINFINTAIFNMPVCDPESLEYQSTGLYNGDLSLYTDFIHPHGWGRKEVRRFLKYEFQKNRAISPLLKSTPPFFNANHAPFFIIR